MKERPEGEMRRKWVKQRGNGMEGKLRGWEKGRGWVRGRRIECGMGLEEGRIGRRDGSLICLKAMVSRRVWWGDITESRPLKNVARENANKREKRKRACITSQRPVNLTVNHVIPHVCRVPKYCFLLRQPKRSAIHRWRIDVINNVILISLDCLKIGQM